VCDYWKKKSVLVAYLLMILFYWSLTKASFKILLIKAHDWGSKNEITFGINKCAILVTISKNFIPYYENSTFELDMNHLPRNNQHSYLGIPFNESLDL